MSFSSNVKQELTDHMSKARHCRLAELSAMISMAAKVTMDPCGITIHSESHFVSEKADRILSEVFGIHARVCYRKGRGGSKAKQYSVTLKDPVEARRVLKALGMIEKTENGEELQLYMPDRLLERSCCRQAYIRGAFLSGGSINDPTKNYHTEILSEDRFMAERLQCFLRDYDIESRIIERKRPKGKSVSVLYLKDGEQIVDLLSVVKAHRALMELENVRIIKDVRNKVNRQVNCETANLNKTVNASVKQVNDIRYLMDHGGMALLTPELKEMAMVRLENENTPLKDLGKMVDPPVSKSGVNHRLRRLSEIAQNLRDQH